MIFEFFTIISGTSFPDFAHLDARIVSALNNIIQNSYFKKKVSLEEAKAQKQDRFLRGRHIAYLICDYFRVMGVNDSVLDYADLFTVAFRNDNIQEFETRWDEILLSMEQFPPDDILESLYKLRTRESEKLKTVLELYILEIYQNMSKPDYHRLETMVKRSIEHELGSRNFESRNGRIECRVHQGQGDCWQWQTTGQCLKGDQCSVRHDSKKMAQPAPSPEQPTQSQVGKNARSTSPMERSPSVRISRQPCKERLQGTGTNAPCEKWHSPERLFFQGPNKGCKFGEKCALAHRRVEEQSSKTSKKNGDESAVAGYVEGDEELGLRISEHGAADVLIDFPEELNHAETNLKSPIH